MWDGVDLKENHVCLQLILGEVIVVSLKRSNQPLLPKVKGMTWWIRGICWIFVVTQICSILIFSVSVKEFIFPKDISTHTAVWEPV